MVLLLGSMTSTAFATDINQAQSLDDVIISIDLRDSKLVQALSEIEHKTEYQFAYDERVLKLQSNISVSNPQISVKEVLLEISRQADVGFQRVNSQIDVKIIKKTDPVRVIESPAEVEVTGQVTDENDQGLPGASVLVKGTSVGTTTDLDGNYLIQDT